MPISQPGNLDEISSIETTFHLHSPGRSKGPSVARERFRFVPSHACCTKVGYVRRGKPSTVAVSGSKNVRARRRVALRALVGSFGGVAPIC